MNIFEYFRNEFGVSRTEKMLEKINEIVDWEKIEKEIQSHREYALGGVGRPRMGIVKMIKCLFLQGLYNLSDPEIEDQLRDRMSFQKFVGIKSEADIPDETTICRFRKELTENGIQENIFTMTQYMLFEKGFTVKTGHMQDGTIIETPIGKPKSRDKEASFVTKNGRSYHGYKGHIETSTKGDYILNTTFTTAKVHDSQQQNALMTGDETLAFGDSAYGMSQNYNDIYEECGMKTCFHEKGYRNHPLTFLQKEMNRMKSAFRARVEHPFSGIKNRLNYRKTRYRGLIKNSAHWFLICAIFNFDRMARLAF